MMEAPQKVSQAVIEAVERQPAIFEKLNRFSEPLALASLKPATIGNLAFLHDAVSGNLSHTTIPSYDLISAAETARQMATLPAWMQNRIRGSNEKSFKKCFYDVVRNVIQTTLVPSHIFPIGEAPVINGDNSPYSQATGVQSEIRKAIAEIGRQNPPTLATDSWARVIEAEAKRNERQGDNEFCARTVTHEQAAAKAREKLETNPVERMQLGIIYAAGLESPELKNFGYDAAGCCMVLFLGWAVFLIASEQDQTWKKWADIFEPMSDAFLAGNFFVGAEPYTILVA